MPIKLTVPRGLNLYDYLRNHICPVQGDSARFSELCKIAQYRSMGAYMRGNIPVAQGLAVESCRSRTRISTMVNPRMFNM